MFINLPNSLGSVKVQNPEVANKVNQSIIGIQKILNFDDSFFPLPQVKVMKDVCNFNLDLIVKACIDYQKTPKSNLSERLRALSFALNTANAQLGQIEEFIGEISKRRNRWNEQKKVLIEFDQLLIFDAIENIEVAKAEDPGYFNRCLQELLDFTYSKLSLPPSFPKRDDLYASFLENPTKLSSFLTVLETQTVAFRRIHLENKVSILFVEHLQKKPEHESMVEELLSEEMKEVAVKKHLKTKKKSKSSEKIKPKNEKVSLKEDTPKFAVDLEAIARGQLIIENLMHKIDKAKRKLREITFAPRVHAWAESFDLALELRKKEERIETFTDTQLIASHSFPKEIFTLIFHESFSRESSWFSPIKQEMHLKKECLITIEDKPKVLEATIDNKGILYHFSSRDPKDIEKDWVDKTIFAAALAKPSEDTPFRVSLRGFTLDENLNVLIDHDFKKIVVYRLHD